MRDDSEFVVIDKRASAGIDWEIAKPPGEEVPQPDAFPPDSGPWLVHPAVERGGGTLNLVCFKCTRAGSFQGRDRADCDQLAFKSGWVVDQGRMICPKCPGVRRRDQRGAA